jgi:glycosyltransferase involved in cell wall biosynthesis
VVTVAPVRIGFDAKRAFHNATGLGNYARDVLRILARHAPEHAYLAYNPSSGRIAPDLPGVEERRPRGWLGRLAPSLWRTRGVVADLAADRVDLYHGLTGELPLGLERSGVAGVVTVHDLIFERFPEWYRPADRAIYRRKTRSAAARARIVVAISEQTKADLVERYDVPPGRIRVVYQGCAPAFREEIPPERLAGVRLRHGLPERFVLAVGTVERRKNLALAVRALAGLPDVTLVAVGRRTPYADEVEGLARAAGVADRLRILEGVRLADLAALYRLAAASVYVSRFEGFGIPIVEALVSGTPVVTTRGGVFPEAGGAAAAYVDPDDAEGLRAALAEILEDPARAAAMRAAGRAEARRFADGTIAEALLAVYAGARG